MNYTWGIKSLGIRNYGEFEKVVVNVNWNKTGTNDLGLNGYYGTTSQLILPEVFNSNTFITYENLTEELLLTWVKSIISNEDEEHSNKLILDQINNQINPMIYVTNNYFPWVESAVAPAASVGITSTSA